MKHKKILVVTYLYLFPGRKILRGGIMIHNSLVNLSKLGHEIKVAFYVPFTLSFIKYFKFSWRKFTFESYQIDGISIYPIFYIPRMSKLLPSFDLFLKSLAFKLMGKKFVINYDIDFIYGQTLYPDGALLPKMSKRVDAPYLVCMRGSDVHTYSQESLRIKIDSEYVLRGAVYVVSVSKKLQDIAKTVFGKDYVKKILYTVCRTDIFKEYRPFSSRLERILFIGAITETKGIHELLDAYNRLKKENENFTLTLIGNYDKKILQKIITPTIKDNKIIVKGRIDDRLELANELNNSDIFIFPSHKEGLPNVIVEAIACMRPVICSDVGGVREICSTNSAFQIVPPKNVESIVNAVKKLKNTEISDLRDFTRFNRKEIVDKFDQKAQLKTFTEIFNELD